MCTMCPPKRKVMMMDFEILSILSNRDRFKQYYDSVKKNSAVLTELAQQVVYDLPDYYQVSTGDDIHWGAFGSWFKMVKHPGKKLEEMQLFDEYLKRLSEYTPDAEVQERIVHALMERHLAEELISICEDIAKGSTRWGVEDLQLKLKAFETSTQQLQNKNVVEYTLEDLLTGVLGGGLEWKQLWMNQSCGPLRKGDFVVLVARPDSGKTSFLSGQANHFAMQLPTEQPVLWLNNEQEGKKVRLRLLQEAVQMDNTEMKLNPEKVKSAYEMLVGDINKIVVIDSATLSASDVERYCEQYNPGCIIIDQLWKVKGCGGDNSDVKVQTAIANWARELCKRYAPVIGVYQADGSAEGQQYFGMDKVYMSKTAVQGEADLIICMGRSYETGKESTRYFHFPKNKMAGGGRYFQPTMKQYKHETTFNADTGVFT